MSDLKDDSLQQKEEDDSDLLEEVEFDEVVEEAKPGIKDYLHRACEFSVYYVPSTVYPENSQIGRVLIYFREPSNS